MKTYYCFGVCAFFSVILFLSCADTPKEGGGIGGEFFTEENQPVKTEEENTNSYENADKLSEEDAKELFVKFSRTAAMSMFGGEV